MIISIIGPSGSGKGTQAKLLSQKLRIPALSAGQILREEYEARSPEGLEAVLYWREGRWVPSDLLVKIIKKHLAGPAYARGFIFDGAPRTKEEIFLWEDYFAARGQKFDLVIHLDTSDETCIKRIQNRFRKAQREGRKMRADESTPAIRERLREYHRAIGPVLDYFKRRGILVRINNEHSVEEVFAEIVRKLPQGVVEVSHGRQESGAD